MTHEEEHVQHDISKLQDQVQQISFSQKVTKNEMDGLKKGMEAKIDGLKNGMEDMEAKIEEKSKDDMEDMNNDIKADMEGLKKGLTKLLQ